MKRALTLIAVGLLAGCGQGTNTPVPQADTPVFGRIADIRHLPDQTGSWEVDVRTGLPETLLAIMRQEGRPVPELEKDLTTKVTITPDTVCIADMAPVDISAFRVGQEVAVTPSPGSSAMIGTKLLLLTADEFYLFSSYQLRYLTRSLTAMPEQLNAAADPRRIDSSGVERTPLPLHGGRVVYFAAGLLPPVVVPGVAGTPRGALREGMREPDGKLAAWAVSGVRPYRVEWRGDAWSMPAQVVFPDVPADASLRVTWVNDDETSCLVTVERPGKPHELRQSSRGSVGAPWGSLEAVPNAVGDDIGDGQRFGKRDGALVWTVFSPNGSDLWLTMGGKDGQPLEPRINTLGSEWAPRVGPNTTLYFCRGTRQLLFASGVIQEVRLPGQQRHPLLEATPTADGALLFFQIPRYTPGGIDTDLAVSAREGATWGAPVRLDDWRPGA